MIEGKAKVIPQSSLSTKNLIELTAGYAKSVNKNGVTSDIRLEDRKFVRDVSSDMQMIYRGDKPIPIGIWDKQLTADLHKDIRNEGQLIEAVKFGTQSTGSVNINGIFFEKSQKGKIVDGGCHLQINDVSDFACSDESLLPLLSTGKELNNKNHSLRIDLEDLEKGQAYRLQLVLGFPWHWTGVNCYGINGEHMYFPNTINQAKLGIATYYWKAQSTGEKIELTSPVSESGSWNSIYIFGYVLHKIDQIGSGE